jgi:hypothetical protein
MVEPVALGDLSEVHNGGIICGCPNELGGAAIPAWEQRLKCRPAPAVDGRQIAGPEIGGTPTRPTPHPHDMALLYRIIEREIFSGPVPSHSVLHEGKRIAGKVVYPRVRNGDDELPSEIIEDGKPYVGGEHGAGLVNG